MIAIWKFPVPVADGFTVEMPAGARVLSVQPQGDSVQMWALVDTDAPNVKRAFAIRGTGHNAEGLDDCRHLGTFKIHGGALVFHMFDLSEKA